MKRNVSMIMLLLVCSGSVWAGANLLSNPGAETGDTSGWSYLVNGGSGWATDGWLVIEGTHSFTSSYAWDRMGQEIDLVSEGYSSAYLDSAPPIAIHDFVIGRMINYADSYYVTVELRDASHGVIATYDTGTLSSSTEWEQVSYLFSGYGSGVRYVYFEQGGKDAEYWAGNYGSSLDAASVRVADTAGITVVNGSTSYVTEGEEPDDENVYAMVLDSEPSANVVIDITPGSGRFNVSPTQLTFTPSNWYVPQFVQTIPNDDSQLQGNVSYPIYHEVSSTDPDYNEFAVTDPWIVVYGDEEAHYVTNPPAGLGFVRADNLSQSVVDTGQAGDVDVLVSASGRYAASFWGNFSQDIDASGISAEIDTENGKAFIHGMSGISGVLNYSLLVPVVSGSGNLVVCPGAESLPEVDEGCSGEVEIGVGETKEGMTVSEISYGGNTYYLIENISGTGGMEIPTNGSVVTLWPGNVTKINSSKWNPGITAGSINTVGGNITSANLDGNSSTEKWGGFYGNVSGSLRLSEENVSSFMYYWAWTPSNGGTICISTNPSLYTQFISGAGGADIDSAWGFPSTATDSGENTFNNSNCSLAFGPYSIYGAAYADTGGPGGFVTCAYKTTTDPGKNGLLFCSNITNGQIYDGSSGNYEIIAPTNDSQMSYETYYFYLSLS